VVVVMVMVMTVPVVVVVVVVVNGGEIMVVMMMAMMGVRRRIPLRLNVFVDHLVARRGILDIDTAALRFGVDMGELLRIVPRRVRVVEDDVVALLLFVAVNYLPIIAARIVDDLVLLFRLGKAKNCQYVPHGPSIFD